MNCRGVAILALLFLVPPAGAATLTIVSTAPTPGTSDVFSFSGASRDGANVGDGAAYADGAANDAFTYIAGDRPDQGQTFTTGSTTNLYTVRSVWVRHVGYTDNTDLTWWQMAAGAVLTLRLTDPAQAGTPGFALAAETCTTTGAEGWSATAQDSANGTGDWLRFSLTTPIVLQANKTYGFDITSSANTCFFEWLGTSNNVYAAGGAYNGDTAGQSGGPDNVLKPLAGDRVFLVELLPGVQTNIPPPVTNSPYVEALTAAEAFPNERVQLLDSRFKQNRELHRSGYLGWLNTNADRLLWPFRNNAGLPQPAGATSLGGWEGTSGFTAVRGHMTGHFLSAASRMYADTGDTNFLNTIHYMVAELRKCQDALSTNEMALGRPYGYLSAFPSSFFDVLETNPTSAQVPFYTIHKIVAGLVDAYRYTTNNLALDMAISMSDYHSWRVAQLTPAQVEAMFVASTGHTEWGGMNEALTGLYLLSRTRGDANPERHLAFAEVFHRDWFINPLSSNQDMLNGLHANTHIPQVTGFARVASVLSTNDPQRDRLYSAASNFWHMVVNQHWLVLGGNSYAEHFSTPGKETGPGGSALAWNTAETCNTYNMLKLTRQLFMHEPSVEYADYYEHALYNHILASLETNNGMMTYFVPMNSGHFKTYCQPTGSCWCCQGTGIENPTRYNEAIYFHKTNVLWVNLFIPSVLDWSEQGLTVRLDTGFPATNVVRLTFNCSQPTNAAVRLRIPSWIAATPTVKLNGTNLGLAPVAGTYLALNRTWSNGDVVELTLPMDLRVDHSMDDPSQVSLFYGPILLAGELGTNGMPITDEASDQAAYSGVADVVAPSLVGDDANNPANWVHPTAAPLVFDASSVYPGGTARSLVQLRPFYDVHHERYAVYWNLIAPTGISIWSGGGAQANWSDSANWNFVPTNQCAIQFGASAGGSTVNDLAAGLRIGGIHFLPSAGNFVLNGNGIVLQGDVANDSSNEQRLGLPVQLNSGFAWIFNAAAGDLTLGNVVTGVGLLNKQGPHTLTVLSNLTFNGSVKVGDGVLQVGNGGAAGSLGELPVLVDAGASLAFNRGDTFPVVNAVSGAGSVIKRGSGTMQLSSVWSNTGPTVVEAGTLEIASRSVEVLKHRWSFNGNLTDSVGASNAVVVNVGANNTTLASSNITLAGGGRNSTDYVSLGSHLLPKDGSPVTIELWATQLGPQNWSRIFDVGSSSSEYLFMSWSRGTDIASDRVEWRDGTVVTVDDSCAPYTIGTKYHLAMVIEPHAGNGGKTRVAWYAAPATDSSLGTARGSLETQDSLADLNDSNFWLGRSEYTRDSTADASYNEVRLWNRAFSLSELEQLHALGPDSIGSFATDTIVGRLSPKSDLLLLAGAQVALGTSTQQVGSLGGVVGSEVRLGGGQLRVSSGGNSTATFAGALTGSGSVVVNGVLRLVGQATIDPGIVLTNNGVLDVMTWNGTLPAGFVNHGAVLLPSLVRIDSAEILADQFRLTIHGYRGHSYQLQCRDDLSSGHWQDLTDPQAGTDALMVFAQAINTGIPCRFYRIAVSP